MSTQIRLYVQSGLGLYFLPKKLLKHFSRRQKQTNCVVIGALRAKTFTSG